MQSFVFYAPTEIVFGRNAEENTAELIKKHGGSRVLIVYGGESCIKSGLLAKLENQLESQNIGYKLYGGVKPNPVLSHTREGIRRALDFGADFILAVGGGSPMDEAKGIAHGAANPGTDVWKFWRQETKLTKSLPVGVVLTISISGSETSGSAVITDDATGEKRGLNSDFNRAKFAVMNPELTYSVPKFQISCGIVDILMHSLDKYFTRSENNGVTDELAAAIMRIIIKCGPEVLKNPGDYNAASEMMWCGSLSHNGLTTLGRPVDFSVHALGLELSGRFDTPHAATLSALWGSWAEHCLDVNPARFAKYAKDVWGIGGGENNIEAQAKSGIERTVEFFKSINMPTCFSELEFGVQSDEVLMELADSCVFYGKRLVGNFKPLDRDEVFAVYKKANR
ncbi:MAG: iron-containing alcohol dehydrogenase [Oscillospiraceae bacterium]|nr:iron-containing alcohol dehydrogenase [Oscillospiraceae bacterium]